MPTVVVVNKTGSLNIHATRFTQCSDLYKTAGLKSSPDFGECARWYITPNIAKANVGTICDIRLFGKTKGHVKFTNAYVFPQPEQNTKFIGTCVLAIFHNDVMANLDVDLWNVASAILNTTGFTTTETEFIHKLSPMIENTEKVLHTPPQLSKPDFISEIGVNDTYMDCTHELQEEPYLTW